MNIHNPSAAGKPRLALAFVAGAITAALACGSPVAPTVASAQTPDTVTARLSIHDPDGLSFPSGAGMTEQREWLLIRPAAGQQYGPVGIAGQVHLTSLEGSGTRFVCVDGNNRMYASAHACR